MSFLFSRNIKSETNRIRFDKKRAGALALAFLFLFSLTAVGCHVNTPQDENSAFRRYTKMVFAQEAASNTVNLHYTLKNPENYGIENAPVTFGNFLTDETAMHVSIENMKESLSAFSYEDLSVQNQLTYDVMRAYFEILEADADYLLYEEPLGLVSGIHTQLPVLLSEYQFYEEKDVALYLELMQTTPEYFDSLIAFEKKKSERGLFMADYAADTVIEQCNAFVDMGDGNYLISTFVNRIQELDELTEKEKSDYIQKNALILKSYVYPAYHKLVSEIQKLKGTGKNEKGLCYLPEGKAYYAQIVKEYTGSDRDISELEDMTRRQIIADLEAMETVLGITAEEVQETLSMTETDPEVILSDLKGKITTAFPAEPKTELQVKYVPEAMEEHLSPAFYMIPAIDDISENVIYVNQAHMNNSLTLFTTLAHEGYPGHLYQTVYYAGTDPDPVRNIFHFGGYIEGWATYAEMCSYYLAPLSKEQAVLLQKNSSIILGLYALADMGIHYDGWDRMDTVAFFKNYGIKDTETIEEIYELIIGSPGNYLKYYIGYVEFLELKQEWAKEKGEDFSQKEFHEAVLSVGPAPFAIVEEYMWKDLKGE
ncbi:DUF885 domain-containing protein [Faecalicatena acetigenes]|uniref:DUF885 domain-containing protein n=1 Tax=Faecalicatena acetigenes TaxID=2981790 RepID=A0ABT2T9I3_9FIRM|nr:MULTISPECIES: DUF885 domain-containing protein [Lachnospiraceae]MCU6746896.1 DUF885 domain-containing protein [Faecalicatena acetigenes]SCH49844.1 Bacterial protein of uncharacterised function (DUF885) [uncultured Clostridium sp.]